MAGYLTKTALQQAGNARFAFRKNKSALIQARADVKSFGQRPLAARNSLGDDFRRLWILKTNREMFTLRLNAIMATLGYIDCARSRSLRLLYTLDPSNE